MSEEKLWKNWKERWKVTEQNAVDIVKEVFRLGGVRLVEKRKMQKSVIIGSGLDFAIEMGWLKDCLTGSYRVTASGLLMLAHQLKA